LEKRNSLKQGLNNNMRRESSSDEEENFKVSDSSDEEYKSESKDLINQILSSPRLVYDPIQNLKKLPFIKKFDDHAIERGYDSNLEMGKDERIKLNIGGTIFETYLSTLRKDPKSLLGTMFHPRNRELLNVMPDESGCYFFDRDPRAFEIILNFYRSGKLVKPDWFPMEILKQELEYFGLDAEPHDRRISTELRKLDYRDRILDSHEYKKVTQHKLLSDHHSTIMMILDSIAQQVADRSAEGYNTCTVIFLSPLHYTDSTPRNVFKVISKDPIRDLITELLEEKKFRSYTLLRIL